MKWLEDMPLKRKVTFVILVTCSTALLLACGVLAAFQMADFRRTIVRDMTVLGDVTAKNTRAALAFHDDRAAAETLLALQSEPNVIAACLYDEEGRRFATYIRSGESVQFPDQAGEDGVRFEGDRLVFFRPVMLNTRRLGTLFIHADSGELRERLLRIAGIAVLVLLGSCAVAFLVSARLQRPISQPIFGLAETVQSIAERKDYSTRVPSGGGYEIGKLTQAFNHLLSSIEERDRALSAANEDLRQEISERQAAELRVQSQLARLEMLHRITRAIGERQDLRSIF